MLNLGQLVFLILEGTYLLFKSITNPSFIPKGPCKVIYNERVKNNCVPATPQTACTYIAGWEALRPQSKLPSPIPTTCLESRRTLGGLWCWRLPQEARGQKKSCPCPCGHGHIYYSYGCALIEQKAVAFAGERVFYP